MKQKRNFPAAEVTGKQELSLKNGHPWVYEDEITSIPEGLTNGCLIDVMSAKHQYLGTGFYSEKSKIRIRILDRNANETFQDDFFRRRVGYALQYRAQVMKGSYDCCRLIYGEADGLPGLTVDRYGGILVSEVLSYGMEQIKPVIYDALIQQLKQENQIIDGIYERNEGELRIKEGLPQTKGWYEGYAHPESPIVQIAENGIHYWVDVENGQKTGFFLDQKFNRLAVRNLAEGMRVLDCCTHTGSFALNAAAGGAASVTALDISETALEMAEKNAQLNHMEGRITWKKGDLFEELPARIHAHEKYDLIILDPPAFTKSRRTFNNARNGYQTVNAQAMQLLVPGGYLATCSCSHFMPVWEFEKMLIEASKEAGIRLKIVEARHAAMDHPVLMGVPETDYLKFYLVQRI